jgi:hypothetical protein
MEYSIVVFSFITKFFKKEPKYSLGDKVRVDGNLAKIVEVKYYPSKKKFYYRLSTFEITLFSEEFIENLEEGA